MGQSTSDRQRKLPDRVRLSSFTGPEAQASMMVMTFPPARRESSSPRRAGQRPSVRASVPEVRGRPQLEQRKRILVVWHFPATVAKAAFPGRLRKSGRRKPNGPSDGSGSIAAQAAKLLRERPVSPASAGGNYGVPCPPASPGAAGQPACSRAVEGGRIARRPSVKAVDAGVPRSLLAKAEEAG